MIRLRASPALGAWYSARNGEYFVMHAGDAGAGHEER
jgi:hypothetical protein